MGMDAAQVDSKHYTVEFENEKVRILRIKYGPGEQGFMHHHPGGVIVSLTDTRVRFDFPNGKSEELELPAGAAGWSDETTHQPVNLRDTPLEAIQIELKS